MSERPRIGITVSARKDERYYQTYIRALEAAGAEAVELPAGTASLPAVDGLLLPGGWDVDPALYGEAAQGGVGPIDRELDETELRLVREAKAAEIPIMGICRGQQVINVALGGSLMQHIDDHDVRELGRRHLAHAVEVEPGSELGQAAEAGEIRVNSLHHQAVRRLAPGLRQTARSEDGTVEGVESGDGMIVAVQCHPEELTAESPWARRLFERFVQRAGARNSRS